MKAEAQSNRVNLPPQEKPSERESKAQKVPGARVHSRAPALSQQAWVTRPGECEANPVPERLARRYNVIDCFCFTSNVSVIIFGSYVNAEI